jgi:hypothetical protein
LYFWISSNRTFKDYHECQTAASFLGNPDRKTSITVSVKGVEPPDLPYGCYTDANKRLWFNPEGTQNSVDGNHNMTSVCRAKSVVVGSPNICKACQRQDFCCGLAKSSSCEEPTSLCNHVASKVVFEKPKNGQVTCLAPQSLIVSFDQCELAAQALNLNDTKAQICYNPDAPLGCYYISSNSKSYQLFFNVAANVTSTFSTASSSFDGTRESLCATSALPLPEHKKWGIGLVIGIACVGAAFIFIAFAVFRRSAPRNSSLSEPLLDEQLEMKVRAVMLEEHESRSREPSCEVIPQLAIGYLPEDHTLNKEDRSSKFEVQAIKVRSSFFALMNFI